MSQGLYGRIYSLTLKIPRGSVASYGQIAREAGCTPRQVGYAMAALPFHSGIPWHRVINSQGKISMRRRGEGDQDQRKQLEGEGIRFDGNGKILTRDYFHRFQTKRH